MGDDPLPEAQDIFKDNLAEKKGEKVHIFIMISFIPFAIDILIFDWLSFPINKFLRLTTLISSHQNQIPSHLQRRRRRAHLKCLLQQIRTRNR